MKNKQDIVNFNQFLNQHDNDRENDIRVGNGLTHK